MYISNHLTLFSDFKVVLFDKVIVFDDISFLSSKYIIFDLESSNLITFSRAYSKALKIASLNLSQLISILIDDV
jgi:hypothetical protein